MVDSAGEKKNTATAAAMDPYKFLNLTKNPDGSLTRNIPFPLAPLRSGDADVVLSKDVVLKEEKKTWMRLFRPNTPPPATKLPLLVHFHGGGFVMFSAATAPFDEFCARVAAAVPAVVVSVEYRLAPEHRLPAAYHDADDALVWLRDHAGDDEWLKDYADVSQCFIDGSSAGGNIAYRVVADAARRGTDLRPLAVAGVILNVPYFGGSGETESETRLYNDRIVPLPANHLMWDLALPIGSNRDHEYCNPMGSVIESDRDWIGLLPRFLVRGYGGDPLVDRQKEFVKMLERFGVEVAQRFSEDGFHAVEMFDPVKAQELIDDVKDFILGSQSRL